MFKTNPITACAKDRDNAKANVDRLATKLAAAEQAVIAARSAAQQLALDGADDRALDRAEAALRAALDRLDTISAASNEANKLVVLLDTRVAELTDKATRAATAAQVARMADDIEEIGAELVPLMTRLAEVTGRADAAQIWSSSSLHAFASSCVQQIPDGVALVAQAVREHSVRVLDGRARATLLTPEAPRSAVAVVEPVVSRVFALQNVMWTVDGQLKTISKFADVDLPPAVAARALASRACVSVDSDTRRQWANTRAVTHPDADQCVSLDGADVVKIDTPMIDGQFVRIDRGKPYEATILRKA